MAIAEYLTLTNGLLVALCGGVAYVANKSFHLGRELSRYQTRDECSKQMARCAASYAHQDVVATRDEHIDDKFNVIMDRLAHIERQIERLIETQVSTAASRGGKGGRQP